jgi:hypothetical protein
MLPSLAHILFCYQGKFTQLQFDNITLLAGSKCVTYLLEKVIHILGFKAYQPSRSSSHMPTGFE